MQMVGRSLQVPVPVQFPFAFEQYSKAAHSLFDTHPAAGGAAHAPREATLVPAAAASQALE